MGETEEMWRTFDVGAVLDSLLIGEARVVAGETGRARTVRTAKMVADPDDLRRVGADELVVTTAEVLLSGHEGWDHLIGQLAAARVAALAVRLDPSHPLPPGLLAAADRLRLPVITFPATAALADVTSALLDALLEAQGHRLERFIDIHERFAPVVLAGGGTTEIASTLHELLRCPVAVLDAEGVASVVVPSDAGRDADLAVVPGVRQPILAGQHHYGEIVALTDGRPLDQDGLLALERASMAIAVRLAHAGAVAAEQARFVATSLEELIAGHAGDTVDVAERASSFGWDLTRPRAVLLASIDPPVDPETLPSALATIAAAARATLGADAIVWTRSTTIAALVAPSTDEADERRKLADGLRLALDERLRTVTVSIGVGRRVDDPAGLPRSYLEASRAVDVGRWAKGRHVTEVFDQLGLERLLASTPTEELGEFVEAAIGALIDHDRAHHTDLTETLGTWLDTRNMAEAARRVHVHYNTFKNRLERIETILGPVLSDANRSLECHVAIYIFRHYDGPWTPAEEG